MSSPEFEINREGGNDGLFNIEHQNEVISEFSCLCRGEYETLQRTKSSRFDRLFT